MNEDQLRLESLKLAMQLFPRNDLYSSAPLGGQIHKQSITATKLVEAAKEIYAFIQGETYTKITKSCKNLRK